MPAIGTFIHRPLTSSSFIDHNPNGPKGTFYFAYGSNLSPTQMTLRCTSTPSRSGIPIAVARLRGWKWHICKRGCANVVYTGKRGEHGGEQGDEVWGVVYDMSVGDEETLDRYEGVDWAAPEVQTGLAANGEGIKPTFSARERPTEQGNGHHNKLYLEVDIVEWKTEGWEEKLGSQGVNILVYVDEYRTEDGTIRPNYVGRMNRGIREAVDLGLSKEWAAKVMRPWVPEGVEAEEGFVGSMH